MMRQCHMRFNGHSWRHNPRSLSFRCEKNIVELLPPFSPGDIKSFGEKPCLIKGEGELFGEDCLEQYLGLRRLFTQAGEGILSIEGLGAFYVTFVSLEMNAEPKDNTLSYSFSFREKNYDRTAITDELYHTAKADETLWDIAFHYAKPIELLIELNPQIRFLDELSEGEKVRVC